MPNIITAINTILSRRPTPTSLICELLPQHSSREILAVLHEGNRSGAYSFSVGKGWTI